VQQFQQQQQQQQPALLQALIPMQACMSSQAENSTKIRKPLLNLHQHHSSSSSSFSKLSSLALPSTIPPATAGENEF